MAQPPVREQSPATMPPRQGSRRAAKAPRRGGLIAGIAAAVVLGAGAGAVALSGMSGDDPPQPTSPVTQQADSTPTVLRTTRPSRPRHTPSPTPTVEEPISTTPSVPPRTATKTPSASPKATPSKTKKSPTPTPAVKKVVPEVLNLPFDLAKQKLMAVGFTLRIDNQTERETGIECGKVNQTIPDGGTSWDVKKPVVVVVVDGPCPSPTMSPTPTPTGAGGPP
jgi:serine/threonine-protein kinase